ncbi:MAG: hypothetical protein J6B91_01485 [Prevotella sp.]|nr:hypothetical protein [Prevotella sp.]
MNRKIKILTITYHPWRDDISVGNTLSNIFHGMEDQLEFANIYIRDDKPCNKIVSRFFKISEKELAKSIFTRKNVGKEIFSMIREGNREDFSVSYNVARRMRWDIFLLIQDMIGLMGNWKSKALDEFIVDFNPDLVFGPLGRMPIVNNIMSYLHDKHNIPLVTYPWDDHYSLHKKSWSPVFWIKLFIERYAIRACARRSEYLYTITSLMKEEYAQYFDKECRLLYKGFNFDKKPPINESSSVLKLIYMGNIGSGRWKILAKIVEAINDINSIEKKLELLIFTLSPISKRIKYQLNVGASHLMEPISETEKMNTLKKADILIHVEPTNTKDRLMFRLSFSTKLVDYFYNAKCILAMGGETASMRYLKENKAGIVELDEKNIKNRLIELVENPNLIMEYSEKSWACGVRNHNIATIQRNVYNDFINIVKFYANK